MMPIDYRDTCTIYRRKVTDKYGGTGADQYDLYADDVPCYFVEREGRMEKQNESGRNIIYSGVMMIDEPVKESDSIVIDEVEYSVLGSQLIRQPNTGIVVYYRVYLQRSAAVDANNIKEEPVVNL